jgi:hypothetical protein
MTVDKIPQGPQDFSGRLIDRNPAGIAVSAVVLQAHLRIEFDFEFIQHFSELLDVGHSQCRGRGHTPLAGVCRLVLFDP